ncbi:GtrA family protein [Nocardioides sp. CPCC 205120]|uniref:GtrA family protein n=1 Tax=Nocardioides sp. CPCC 205120 TaxID=3406462 RepID=UPI003B510CC5
MGRRWRRLAAEVSKFSLVGGLATLVSFVLFNALLHGAWVVDPVLGDRPYSSYVLANTIGMLVSYSGTKRWVFRHRQAPGADGGFLAYAGINVVTMVLPMACLWFSRSVLGLSDPVADNISANVIGLSAGFVARFYLFRTYVFNSPVQRASTVPAAIIAEPTGPSTAAPARRTGSSGEAR